MMKINNIITALEFFASPELQEEWDNGGLLTGDGDWQCSGVLCSLDVTVEVVAEAIDKHCNLIVCHHPVVFKGLKKLNGSNYAECVIIKAIRNDIAIYAAHTNLDNVLTGVSGKMAETLSLKNVEVLSPKANQLRRLITFVPVDKAREVRQALFGAGAGQIGKYSECSFNSNGTGTFKAEGGTAPYVGEIGKPHEEPETRVEIVFPVYIEKQVIKTLIEVHPYEEVAYDIFSLENVHPGIGAGVIGELNRPMTEEEFLQKIKAVFNTGCIRHSALRGELVRKVALCGGAGAFLMKNAAARLADVYITADIKYHEFFDVGERMVVADIGHYESEQFTIELLHDLLVEKFPTFAVLKTRVKTNPVHYFV